MYYDPISQSRKQMHGVSDKCLEVTQWQSQPSKSLTGGWSLCSHLQQELGILTVLPGRQLLGSKITQEGISLKPYFSLFWNGDTYQIPLWGESCWRYRHISTSQAEMLSLSWGEVIAPSGRWSLKTIFYTGRDVNSYEDCGHKPNHLRTRETI
jgi:hypothetical protein